MADTMNILTLNAIAGVGLKRVLQLQDGAVEVLGLVADERVVVEALRIGLLRSPAPGQGQQRQAAPDQPAARWKGQVVAGGHGRNERSRRAGQGPEPNSS